MASSEEAYITCKNATLIISTHLEDIGGNGGKKRDWLRILEQNRGWYKEENLTVAALKEQFENLSLKGNVKNPFPDPAHFYYPVLPPFVRMFSCSRDPGQNRISVEKMERKIKDIVRVAELVSPEIFFSPPCVTYLGYAIEPIEILGEEDSFLLEERYTQAKQYFSPGKKAAYEAWEKKTYGSTATCKGRGLVKLGRETYGSCPWQMKTSQMATMISTVEDGRNHVGSVDVNLSTKASSLWFVTFQRRNMLNGNGEKVRSVLSDYELMNIFEQGRLRKFNFEKASIYQWGKLLRRCDIVDVPGRDAYWDFFKYCAPRLQFLLDRLAPHLQVARFHKLQITKELANIVVFQSVHEFGFVKVLKEIYRQEYIMGIAVVKPLSADYDSNIYSAALKFTYDMLVGNMSMFHTTTDDFFRCRLSLANDICLNWRKFYYDQNGNKF